MSYLLIVVYTREEVSVSGIRKKTLEGLKVGDSFSITRTFTRKDVFRFADITRDYNPVHFDERFSRVKNFRGRICHTLLVASMISEIGGRSGGVVERNPSWPPGIGSHDRHDARRRPDE